MTCTPIKLEGGARGFACGRRGKKTPKPCSACGQPATRLCDFNYRTTEISGGMQRLVTKTCDKPLCDSCRVSIGPELDHCPSHKTTPAAPQQMGFDL